MPGGRILTPALAVLGCAGALAAGAAGQTGGTQPGPQPAPQPGNPCLGPEAGALLCPDLQMAPPSAVEVDRRTIRRRVLLRSTNSIDSVGEGPASLRGRREGLRTMGARQIIHRVDGTLKYVRTGARLYFQPIPDQDRYWKMADAARFELWSVDPAGNRLEQLRVGPKQNYCLRDLKRTRRMPGSPRRRVYPACSQDRRLRAVTLGTSVGWSDVYPATYHQNWIDVTGVPPGLYLYVHIADPKNGIWENDEQNNQSEVMVSLPSGRVVGAPPPEQPAPTGGY